MQQRVRISLLSALLMLVMAAAPATAQETGGNAGDDSVVKTVCLSWPGYNTEEELKSDLLLRAKREAAAELFGELIVAATTVDNLVVTSDQLRLQSLGLLRLEGDARYSNGENFGEMCVTLTAYVNPQDRALFKPETISGRSCVTEPLLVRELRAKAEADALVNALVQYDPRLHEYETRAIMPLLRKVSYPESGLVAGTDSYCATVRGVVVPIEVVSFLSLEGNLAAVDAAPAIRTPAAKPQPAAPTRTNTPIRLPTNTATATPTPNIAATTAAEERLLATSIAATLAALPISTATATPNIHATKTVVAQQLAAAVVATLTAIATRTVTATPEPTAGTIREIQGIPFVYVPAGEFLMGSTEEQIDAVLEICQHILDDCDRSKHIDEEPQHTVYLDAYWIMMTEVTNDHYGRCVAAGVCSAPEDPAWKDAGRANLPATTIDWRQAQTFALWLGGRLPTEAEWEKAARGPDGPIYPWGDIFDGTRLNYCDVNCGYDWKDLTFDDGVTGLALVGSYPTGASPYGALDMAGNVWEWTADRYDSLYYANSPTRNPVGPDAGELRLLRGGAFNSYEGFVRPAFRNSRDPMSKDSKVGFRVVFPGS